MDINGQDTTSSIPDDLQTQKITAEQSFTLSGKYVLPTTKPTTNNVILAGPTTTPDGAVICEWGVELGGGDVVGNSVPTIDNEIVLYDGTSGKAIKTSNILISNITRNPMTSNLDANGNNILNAGAVEANVVIAPDVNFERATDNVRQGLTFITNDEAPAGRWFMGSDIGTDDIVLRNTGGNTNVRFQQDGTMNITHINDETKYEFKDKEFVMNTAGGAGTRATIDFIRAGGTLSAPTAVGPGVGPLGIVEASGYDGSSYVSGISLNFETRGTWTPTSHPSTLSIYSTDLGGTIGTEKLRVDYLGIGIGEGEGATSNGYLLPLTRGTDGQVLRLGANGFVAWDDEEIPSFQGSYGLQYFLNNTVITSGITLVNTYVDVVGNPRQDGELNNFTTQANSMTYTGTDTQMFKVEFSCNWVADGNSSDLYELAFHKNGVVIPAGEMTGRLDNITANYPRNITTMTFVELATNDILTIKVRNTSTAQDVIFQDMVFSAHAINLMSVGGTATTTLQDAYDNSTSPEIITNVSNGALQVKSGAGAVGGVEVINSLDQEAVRLGDDGQVYAQSGLTLGTSPTTHNINNVGGDLQMTTQAGSLYLNHTANTLKLGATGGFTEIQGLSFINSSIFQVNQLFDNSSNGVLNIVRKARGTQVVPTGVLAGDDIAEVSYRAYDGTAYRVGALMRVTAEENITALANGSSFTFETATIGTTSKVLRMKINSNGIQIGDGAFAYTLPLQNATSGNQVLRDALGDGVVAWQDLQTCKNFWLIDADLTTDNAELILNSGNITNTTSRITFKHDLNVKYAITSDIAGDDLVISRESEVPVIELKQNGTNVIHGATTLIPAVGEAYELPLTKGTNTQVLTSNGDGTTQWADASGGGARSYGEIYTIPSWSFRTAITAIDTYYLLEATQAHALGEAVDFVLTGTGNGLGYTGATTKKFRVSASISSRIGSLAVSTFSLEFHKNGARIPKSEIRVSMDDTTTWPRSTSVECIVELAQNDTIDLRVANRDNTNNFTMISYSMTVVEV